MEEKVHRRIAEIKESIPGSIGDIMHFQLLNCDSDCGDYFLTCRTEPWMRNFAGTLHGGMCAAILDQAMGIISYCLKSGEGAAPAMQLKADFHRPLHPGEGVLVKVHVVSATRRLIHLSAEAWQASRPDKIAISGSGIYFCKSTE